jgi:SAM-dependent methyltransferase
MFDRARLRARRDRKAAAFDQYDFLKRYVSNQIIERLADNAHTFASAFDLGCHTGTLALALTAHDHNMSVGAADLSPAMAEIACARGVNAITLDEETLLAGPNALAAGGLDLITSALSLHWVNDLPGILAQIRTALRPDGLFLGALFGAGTLPELRLALSEAETELTGGAAPRLSPLPRLQDMAALMQRAGFALPVVDVDKLTVHYASPDKLLEDLGGMAERAAFAAPAARGLSRRVLSRMTEIYVEEFSDARGKVPATFQIIHLSGWAPAPHQPQPKKRGSATISLAEGIEKVRALNAPED